VQVVRYQPHFYHVTRLKIFGQVPAFSFSCLESNSRSPFCIYSKSNDIPDLSVHAWIIPLTFLLGSSMSHSAILRNARRSTTALQGKSRAPWQAFAMLTLQERNPGFPPLSPHVRSQTLHAMSQPSFPRSREFAIRLLKAMASFMFAHCSTSRYRWVQIIGIGLWAWAYQCRASLRFTARVGPTQLFPPSQPQARSLEPLLDVVTYFI
jgi:hypothetical protein